jgi:hypothetical protein
LYNETKKEKYCCTQKKHIQNNILIRESFEVYDKGEKIKKYTKQKSQTKKPDFLATNEPTNKQY